MSIAYNKNGIAFDIDSIATDLNGKADVDLTNLDSLGKTRVANYAMPSSSKYVNLTFSTTGTFYTAPADGWVVMAGTLQANGRIRLTNETSRLINGCICTSASSQYDGACIPVAKGQTFTVYWNNITTDESLLYRFVYANGSEHEAS